MGTIGCARKSYSKKEQSFQSFSDSMPSGVALQLACTVERKQITVSGPLVGQLLCFELNLVFNWTLPKAPFNLVDRHVQNVIPFS